MDARLTRRDAMVTAAAAATLSATPVPKFTTLVQGLLFPEGPIALAGGDMLVVEMARGTLTRIGVDGTATVAASTNGGPNGACYICNNGGMGFVRRDGVVFPAVSAPPPVPNMTIETFAPPEVPAGIQRVDLKTGAVTTLYTSVNGRPFGRPNDLAFEPGGGFWFTDSGRSAERGRDYGGVYWARPDGSEVREVVFPLLLPNGIALSPDRRTLYVVLTLERQIVAYDIAEGGQLAMVTGKPKVRVIASLGGDIALDSMAVDAAGMLVVGTLRKGGLTVVDPNTGAAQHIPLPDAQATNVAFGGADLRTALVTLSTTGRVIALPWPRPGVKPVFGG